MISASLAELGRTGSDLREADYVDWREECILLAKTTDDGYADLEAFVEASIPTTCPASNDSTMTTPSTPTRSGSTPRSHVALASQLARRRSVTGEITD